MKSEPFDPTPQTPFLFVEVRLAQAARNLRGAYIELEEADPELCRRAMSAHKTVCELLNLVRT